MEKNPRPNLVGSPKMDSQSSVLRDLCVLACYSFISVCTAARDGNKLGLFTSIQKEPPPPPPPPPAQSKAHGCVWDKL